jgi:hypothetical protein
MERLGEGELTLHYRLGGPAEAFACGGRQGCITAVLVDVTCRTCKFIGEQATERAMGEPITALHLAYEHEVQRLRPYEEMVRMVAKEWNVGARAARSRRQLSLREWWPALAEILDHLSRRR